jgi:hypothetical protein
VPLAAKSVDTLNAHVRQYCNAHPLASFWAAVSDFFGTLPVRHVDREMITTASPLGTEGEKEALAAP